MTWTGFYLGANGGFGWGQPACQFLSELHAGRRDWPLVRTMSACTARSSWLWRHAPTFSETQCGWRMAGIQGGYNWQLGRSFVIGVEADYDWGKVDGSGFSSFLFIPQGTLEDPRSAIVVTEKHQGIGDGSRTVRMASATRPHALCHRRLCLRTRQRNREHLPAGRGQLCWRPVCIPLFRRCVMSFRRIRRERQPDLPRAPARSSPFRITSASGLNIFMSA